MKAHHPFLLFLIVVMTSTIPTSCSMCGYEYPVTGMDLELWSAEMNRTQLKKVYTWPSESSYDSPHSNITPLGLDSERHLFYYSTRPRGMGSSFTRMELQLPRISTIQLDEDANSVFTLSPKGNYFAYQKQSRIWITTVDGSVTHPIPTHPEIPVSRHPRWHQTDEQLIFSTDNGLWMLNLADSTYRNLFDSYPDWYTISADGRWIAVESRKPDGTKKILLVDSLNGEQRELVDGFAPRFVNGDTEILYERDEGIYVTTLTGFYRKYYPKTYAYSLSSAGHLLVSPKGRYVVILIYEGMLIIDMTTSTIVKTIKTDHPDIQPDDMYNWPALSFRFPKVFFNADESKVYFILERTYSDDGC